MTNLQTLSLPSPFPTLWASEWGQDANRLYADFSFKAIVQRFRWIAPGTFLMGSPKTELERYDDEI